MKRISLFLAINFLVMITLSTLLSVLGVRPYLTQYGLDIGSLAIFCLVWGMGGAFISLLLSRVIAKWMMGVKVIDASVREPRLASLVSTVHRLSKSAGMQTMPQVGVYDSPEVNAFATGPSQARSLVAVSTGLLSTMNQQELEGVLAHEIAHITNGDMVTMTLLQGIVNAFVMFLARIIAFAIANAGKGNRDDNRAFSSLSYMLTVMVLEMVLMLFGSMVVAAYSRHREFRADAGGAKLAGRGSMIAALKSLQNQQQRLLEGVGRDPQAHPAMNALKISHPSRGFLALFATHPPLERRIRHLESASLHA